MHKNGSLLLLLLVTVLGATAAFEVIDGPLGFEDGDEDFVLSFAPDLEGEGSLESSDAAYKGSYGARVTIKRPSGSAEDAALSSPAYPLEAGEYSWSFWAKARPDAMVRLVVTGSDGGVLARRNSVILAPVWREQAINFSMPLQEGGEDANATLSVHLGKALGVFSFDDFSLSGEESEEEWWPSPPPPSPSPAAPSPSPVAPSPSPEPSPSPSPDTELDRGDVEISELWYGEDGDGDNGGGDGDDDSDGGGDSDSNAEQERTLTEAERMQLEVQEQQESIRLRQQEKVLKEQQATLAAGLGGNTRRRRLA